MKILILAAMDKEVELLKNILTFLKKETIENQDVFTGVIGNHHILIAKCGIGKVNAAVNTYRLMTAIEPDLVINSGVAGGVNAGIGSLLIADKVVYHDVWCGPGTPYGKCDSFDLFFYPSSVILEKTKYLFNDDENVKIGLICSGDKFISQASEVKFIKEHFPKAIAVDMESAAISQVCTMLEVPFSIIRVISDTPGEGENVEQYSNFWKEAPLKTFEMVKQILSAI